MQLRLSLNQRVGDQRTDDDHEQQTDQNSRVGESFEAMHSPTAARSQCPIRTSAREQKKERVGRENVIGERIDLSDRDDNSDQPDHRQTHTDHRSGDRENVNAEVFFEWNFAARFGHETEVSTG
jgi:hypothetical protein